MNAMHENNVQNIGLDQALDANAKMQQGPGMKDLLRSATQAAAESGYVRWLGEGARLLSSERERLLRAEHEYAISRAKIVADAEQQLARFRVEWHEQLVALDDKHHRKVEAIQRDITRLEQAREIGSE